MSSIKVNWNTLYQNGLIHIQFWLFNRTFDTKLMKFNNHLRLPYGGVWTPDHENFNEQQLWVEITSDKRTQVKDISQSYVTYSISGSKGTLVYNLTC